jgi:MFS family permease
MVTDKDAVDVPGLQRAVMRSLSVAQVLTGVGVASGVAAGSLLIAEVSGSDAWAGLAQTGGVVGAALAAVPLARLSATRGRRTGLATGLLVATGGAGVVLWGTVANSLAVLLLGMLLVGVASAVGLQARYAATDLAEPRHTARALSLVVWATTVGAVLGPNLMQPAADLAAALTLPPLAGPYLVTGAALLVAAVVIAASLRPDPLLTARRLRGEHAAPPHVSLRASMRIVAGSPGAVLGMAALVLGQAVMVMVMVMTPVHMQHVDVTLSMIGLVISVHILGMYALSPVVGSVSDRTGPRAVIAAGGVILLFATAIAGTAAGGDVRQLGVGLFLLGLGWSCTLVAGSALLTRSVAVADRPAVQGAGDTLIYVGGATAGAVAGVVVTLGSYGWLNLLAAMLVAPLAVAVGWERRRLTQTAT